MSDIEGADEYRRLIEELASKSINHRVSNGQPAHASILIETMLNHARGVVRIFTGAMAPQAYDKRGLIDAAVGFLRKPGTKLRVLVQEPVTKDQLLTRPIIKAADECKLELRGSLEVRRATGVYATSRAHHFATMDDSAYRYEQDHEKMLAVANFNEPSTVKTLIEAFDQAFLLGTPTLLVPS